MNRKPTKQTNIFIRCALYAFPIWALLLIDIYVFDQGLGMLVGALHAPGAFIMLILNPTWQQLHSYSGWHLLVGDIVFYYLLVLLLTLGLRYIRGRLYRAHESL